MRESKAERMWRLTASGPVGETVAAEEEEESEVELVPAVSIKQAQIVVTT